MSDYLTPECRPQDEYTVMEQRREPVYPPQSEEVRLPALRQYGCVTTDRARALRSLWNARDELWVRVSAEELPSSHRQVT